MSQENHDLIFELAETIFSKPPTQPHSIQLEMDLDYEDGATIAEVLVILFSCGVRLLYATEEGPPDISDMGPSHIALLKAYFASMGFTLHLEIEPWSQPQRKGHFTYGKSNALSAVTFCLYRNESVYKLTFDFLQRVESCPD